MAKFQDTLQLVDKVSKPLLKMSRNFAKLDKSIEKSQSKLENFQKRTERKWNYVISGRQERAFKA